MTEALIILQIMVILALVIALLRQRESLRRLSSQQNRSISAQDQTLVSVQQNLATAENLAQDLRAELVKQEHLIAELRQQIATTERESLQSKALFATIANVAYDLVFVLDAELTIVASNRSAGSFFGQLSPVGEKLTQIIEAPDLDLIVQRAFDEEERLEEQFSYKGQYYKVRTQVIRYQDDGVFVGVALQDITQLVRLNRSRRDMVANISHELRTPIANIRLRIDSLFHDEDKPKRKASIQSLRDIGQETDALEKLVQELLDLSMIESGQAIMKLVPLRLIEVVEEAIERLQDQLDDKRLTMVLHVPQKLEVFADRDQARRVFVNLIRNAIKWSPEGDAITISAQVNGEDVAVSIYDNGPGVPENQRERIFERFYQVDTARTKREGSGLGLAICKHIVEAHGGQIWAEGNSQGSGGRFMFTLLNATPAEPQSEMDRGQHDFPLRPTAVASSESVSENAVSENVASEETPEEEIANDAESPEEAEVTATFEDADEDVEDLFDETLTISSEDLNHDDAAPDMRDYADEVADAESETDVTHH